MIRILLTVILPFLAPTIMYLVWMKIRRDRIRARNDGTPLPEWEKLPWPWLIGSGSVLVIIGFVFFGLQTEAKRDQIYVPPQMIDGELVPGHFIDPPEEDTNPAGSE